MRQPASGAATIEVWSPSRRRRAAAWGTHLFMATGAVWGVLALLAINREQWAIAFAWMGIALYVDRLDGAMARRVRIQETLPIFDGALLDNVGLAPICRLLHRIQPLRAVQDARHGAYRANCGPIALNNA